MLQNDLALPRRVWFRDRHQILSEGIPSAGKTLEVGPLFRPITTRSSGYDAYTIDVAPAAELRATYAHLGETVNAIQEVDFILKRGDLAISIPSEHHNTFDAILASHVLEHVPNPIAFIESCAKLLKPGGSLNLALPDKRFCFDLFRPVSTTSDWLRAFRENRVDHSWDSRFQFLSYSVRRNKRLTWDGAKTRGLLHPMRELEESYVLAADSQDIHAWVFTPNSFTLLAHECYTLGVTSMPLIFSSKTRGHEFFCRFKNAAGPKISLKDRTRLMTKALIEQSPMFSRFPF